MANSRLQELSDLFKETGIYSQNRYTPVSPLRVFQKEYPNHNYSEQIEEFIGHQKVEGFGDGADLPWWGDSYFTNRQGTRVMILTQDSLGPNKGSVVVYMPFLMDEQKTTLDLNNYIRKYGWQRFAAFSRFRKLFQQLKMDKNFLYVTDARKVSGEWQMVLEKEIEIVCPNVILCLGKTGLEYLTEIKGGITSIVDKEDTTIKIIKGKLPRLKKLPIVVASLFPSGSNGHYTVSREQNTVNTFNMVITQLDS